MTVKAELSLAVLQLALGHLPVLTALLEQAYRRCLCGMQELLVAMLGALHHAVRDVVNGICDLLSPCPPYGRTWHRIIRARGRGHGLFDGRIGARNVQGLSFCTTRRYPEHAAVESAFFSEAFRSEVISNKIGGRVRSTLTVICARFSEANVLQLYQHLAEFSAGEVLDKW